MRAVLTALLSLFLLLASGGAEALVFPSPDNLEAGLKTAPYEEALRLAAENDSLVLLYFWTDWCSNCAAFSKNVLTMPSIVGALNKDFLLVSLDSDTERELSTKYRVRVVPTLLFLDSQGAPVSVLPGAIPGEIFGLVLEYMSSGAYVGLEFEDYLDQNPDLLKDAVARFSESAAPAAPPVPRLADLAASGDDLRLANAALGLFRLAAVGLIPPLRAAALEKAAEPVWRDLPGPGLPPGS
ncbi:MAG: thioredoxin family protein [Deltaproteobacteria bacterium]|jgi:thioredoxin-related protein|nr:thioredoxin family protein [Deltaproteobacteria bacterium]